VSNRAVIVSAARTAIGTFGGAFVNTPATKLGALAVKEAIRRAGIDAKDVDEVILGNVISAGLGLNAARVAALEAGVPREVPSFGVNKACGSGLKAIALAAQSIATGEADIVVAGGMENMTAAPYLMNKARYGYRLGHDQVLDAIISDGLTCPINRVHMGITAENIAEKYGISRQAQDEFAAASQRKAGAAMDSGAFDDEIFAVELPAKKGDPVVVKRDEHPRPKTNLEGLAALKPAFKPNGGTVTAGNASGLNDGAAGVVVMTAAKAAALGLTPLARIASYASAGLDPKIMGMGPVPAARKALQRAGWNAADLDLLEINEAFAAQACAVHQQMGWDTSKVNVNGGAIAMGHPLGATGAVILGTALDELERRNLNTALITLCVGAGMGTATIIERV
jgi:acetyl-CoA C-acetyltransferase